MNRRDILKSAAVLATGALVSVSPKAGAVAADEPKVNLPAGSGRKILLYSGWAVHNIGDIGHTPGTLRYLEQYLPGASVTCWILKTNDAVSGMLRKRFPNVPLVQGSLNTAGVASTPELQAAFDGCDLFVQNSGMHFNKFWAPPLNIVLACEAKKKPIGLYGQSFDSFRPQDAERMPGLLSKTSFIFTRDTESLPFLRKAGVTSPVLEFGPDGCFGIDVRDDASAAAFMTAKGLEPKKFVAVIIRTDLIELRTQMKDDPSAAVKMQERTDVWCGKVIEVVTDIVRRTGLKVALVSEVEKEMEASKTRVLDKLPPDVKPMVIHRDTWWNADEAVSFYAQAHSLVAMEPHSCIMALAVGTPAIHYFSAAHGTKAWMFRDVGLSEWLIDVDAEPSSTVIRALDRIRGRYELAQAKVARAMDFVNRRSAEMMSDVAVAASNPRPDA